MSSVASVGRALSLHTAKTGEWATIKSMSPFVDHKIKYAAPNLGERSITIGTSSSSIDSSKHEVAAHMFAYMSRERVRISFENGDKARLLVDESSPHDHTIATIKQLPYPFSKREFVNRLISARDANGDYLMASVPAKDQVDYGMSSNTVHGMVRGIARIFVRIGTDTTDKSRCRVTFYGYVDFGGYIPAALMSRAVPRMLAVVEDLRDVFQVDEEFDKEELARLASIIRGEGEEYTEEERHQLSVTQLDLGEGVLSALDFETLESLDHLVNMSWMMFTRSDMVLRASTVVDAPLEDCLAWEIAKLSRAAQKRHFKEHGKEQALIGVDAHSGTYHDIRGLDVPRSRLREWRMRYVWKYKDVRRDEVLLCYTTIDDADDTTSYVKVQFSGFVVFKKQEAVGAVSQTLVSVAARMDIGGHLPRSYLRKVGVHELCGVGLMRQQFDRSLEVDGEVRSENMKMIAEHAKKYSTEKDHADAYSMVEALIVIDGERHFEEFEGMKAKSLKMESPLTTGEIAFQKNDSHAWGRATTTVRTSPKEVRAPHQSYRQRALPLSTCLLHPLTDVPS